MTFPDGGVGYSSLIEALEAYQAQFNDPSVLGLNENEPLVIENWEEFLTLRAPNLAPGILGFATEQDYVFRNQAGSGDVPDTTVLDLFSPSSPVSSTEIVDASYDNARNPQSEDEELD